MFNECSREEVEEFRSGQYHRSRDAENRREENMMLREVEDSKVDDVIAVAKDDEEE